MTKNNPIRHRVNEIIALKHGCGDVVLIDIAGIVTIVWIYGQSQARLIEMRWRYTVKSEAVLSDASHPVLIAREGRSGVPG